jgi:hypothetical protein
LYFIPGNENGKSNSSGGFCSVSTMKVVGCNNRSSGRDPPHPSERVTAHFFSDSIQIGEENFSTNQRTKKLLMRQ